MQRRSAHRLRLLTLLLAAISMARIENRLDVDITTVVHADGSCTRRTVYRLERVDKEGTRFDISPDEDPLFLLHRFPSSQAWTVDHDVKRELHSVTLEASLPFHATLVMPAPIVRAHTCAQGDTASWEFDAEDLFGRGFEMWAVATTEPAPEQLGRRRS